MNATKNETTTTAKLDGVTTENEELLALYAQAREAGLEVALLSKLLTEAEDKLHALVAQIHEKEEKMAEEKAKKNEAQVASETAKSKRAAKKNKKQSKKNAKESQPAEQTATTTETETATETTDPKTAQRRAARAIGRENKAKYARWEKEAKKILPVYDRPNHIVAYKYFDENGVLLGRKPVSKK